MPEHTARLRLEDRMPEHTVTREGSRLTVFAPIGRDAGAYSTPTPRGRDAGAYSYKRRQSLNRLRAYRTRCRSIHLQEVRQPVDYYYDF